MPLDRFGRQINYLRISLTDHCNLRCLYCMPIRGLQFVAAEEQLTAAEIAAVAEAAVNLGFHKFRLTGGEPTLRTDLVEIVERLAALPGVDDLSMTTNGMALPRLAGPLRRAGLHRVNIHIDSLNAQNLRHLMRFGSVGQIWAGIEAAQSAGFAPIKLNCAVARDHNDHDVVELARLTLDRPWHVRFIELMPLGGGECAQFSLSQFVPTRETRSRIEAALGPLSPVASASAADESRNYRLEDAAGVVGFISPVSEPYCGTCNRMRLTSDGKFHLCLLNDDEMDVRAALRSGGGVEAVEGILAKAIAAKPTGHRLDEGVSVEAREMFQIGG
jgi:cyclic pyranopterin phosphate synthase